MHAALGEVQKRLLLILENNKHVQTQSAEMPLACDSPEESLDTP